MTELSKAYGGALYALAMEEKLEEEIRGQLDAVCAILAENPAYVRLIASRSVGKAERIALLDEAFSGRAHAYLLNFMKILCERGAFEQMPGCRDAYVKEYNERHGIVPATAVTASPLTREQRERLVAALEKRSGKSVELTERVDASLVGGMRVEMEGIRYDNTVASKLGQLRRALLAKS